MIKTVINPSYKQLEDFVINLPETFSHSGETIYAERNTIKLFEAEGIEINIKSFKRPIFINQIAYTTFRKSKARRSFEYALKLKEKGFETPAPIAYIEQKEFGLLKDSFYISVNEHFDGIMRELKNGRMDEYKELLFQFAQYTARLHEEKVLHLDYSAGNILYKKKDNNYTFYLVDLNRMIFDKPVDVDTACFNFRRLWGSDSMISFFVEEYAKSRNFDTETCLKKTFEYRKKFWDTFIKNHPGSSPYDAKIK